MAELALGFFVLGIILLGVEVCMPGFGVPGIIGICCVSLAIIMISRTYGTVAVCLAFIVIVLLLIIMIKFMRDKGIYKKVILEETGFVKDFDESKISHLMGREGITITPLKPYGKVDFDGFITDVTSIGIYIPEGTRVVVIQIDGKNLTVKEIVKEEN